MAKNIVSESGNGNNRRGVAEKKSGNGGENGNNGSEENIGGDNIDGGIAA